MSEMKIAKEKAKAIVDAAKEKAKISVDSAKAKAAFSIEKAKAKAVKVIDAAKEKSKKSRKQKGGEVLEDQDDPVVNNENDDDPVVNNENDDDPLEKAYSDIIEDLDKYINEFKTHTFLRKDLSTVIIEQDAFLQAKEEITEIMNDHFNKLLDNNDKKSLAKRMLNLIDEPDYMWLSEFRYQYYKTSFTKEYINKHTIPRAIYISIRAYIYDVLATTDAYEEIISEIDNTIIPYVNNIIPEIKMFKDIILTEDQEKDVSKKLHIIMRMYTSKHTKLDMNTLYTKLKNSYMKPHLMRYITTKPRNLPGLIYDTLDNSMKKSKKGGTIFDEIN